MATRASPWWVGGCLTALVGCVTAPPHVPTSTADDAPPEWDDAVVLDTDGEVFGAAAFASAGIGDAPTLLAFGDEGAVFTSEDLGTTWAPHGDLGTAAAALAGLTTRSLELAVGEGGLLRLRRLDAAATEACGTAGDWHPPCRLDPGAIPSGVTLRGAAPGGDDQSLLVVGDHGTVLRAETSDPERWTRLHVPAWVQRHDLHAVARVGDANVVVGDHGFVLLVRQGASGEARLQEIDPALLGLDPDDPPDLLDVVADDVIVQTKWAARAREARLGYRASFLVVGDRGTVRRVTLPLRKPSTLASDVVVVEAPPSPPWGTTRLRSVWSDDEARVVAGEHGAFFVGMKGMPFAEVVWTPGGPRGPEDVTYVDVVGAGRVRLAVGMHGRSAVTWRAERGVPTCSFQVDPSDHDAPVALDVWRTCLGGEGPFPSDAFTLEGAALVWDGSPLGDTADPDPAPTTAPAWFDEDGVLHLDIPPDENRSTFWQMTVFDHRDPAAPVTLQVQLTPWALADRAASRNPWFRFRSDLGGPALALDGRADLEREVMADIYTGWGVTAPGEHPSFVGTIVDEDPAPGAPADQCGSGDEDDDVDGPARIRWSWRTHRFVPGFVPDMDATDTRDVVREGNDPFQGVIAALSRLRSSVGQDYTDDVYGFAQGYLPRLATMKQYVQGACQVEATCIPGAEGSDGCSLADLCCRDGVPGHDDKYPLYAPFDGRLFRMPAGGADPFDTTLCGGVQPVDVDDTLDSIALVSHDDAVIVALDHVQLCRELPADGLEVHLGERIGRGSRWHGGDVVVWVRETTGERRLVSYWDLLPAPLYRIYQSAFGMAERGSGEVGDPVILASVRDACPLSPALDELTGPGVVPRLVCAPTCAEEARRDWIVHPSTAMHGSWETCSE
jgi:hypothetical protein